MHYGDSTKLTSGLRPAEWSALRSYFRPFDFCGRLSRSAMKGAEADIVHKRRLLGCFFSHPQSLLPHADELVQ